MNRGRYVGKTGEFHHRSESNLTREVMSKIKLHYGQDVYYYKSSDRFTIGILDIILCFFGYFVAIELKVGANEPTTLQKVNIQRIQRANGFAFSAKSWAEVQSGLEKIREVIGRA